MSKLTDTILDLVPIGVLYLIATKLNIFGAQAQTKYDPANPCPFGQHTPRQGGIMGFFGDCPSGYHQDLLGECICDQGPGSTPGSTPPGPSPGPGIIGNILDKIFPPAPVIPAIQETGCGTIHMIGAPDIPTSPGDFIDPNMIRSGQWESIACPKSAVWGYSNPLNFGSMTFPSEKSCYDSCESRGYASLRMGFSGGCDCINV